MAIQEVSVLNDLGAAKLERRERTTSTGTSVRYTLTMEAEPILHDWATLQRAPHVAAAVVELLKVKVRGIRERASPDTLLRRQRYAAELQAGKPAARARYSGGRLGPRPPNARGDALFNDSGRFAESIVLGKNEDGFTVNVAANRLDQRTFGGGEAAVIALVRRLQQLVPEFRGGREVLKHPEVQQAIAEDATDAIFVAGQRASATAYKARWRKVQSVLRTVQTVFEAKF